MPSPICLLPEKLFSYYSSVSSCSAIAAAFCAVAALFAALAFALFLRAAR